MPLHPVHRECKKFVSFLIAKRIEMNEEARREIKTDKTYEKTLKIQEKPYHNVLVKSTG